MPIIGGTTVKLSDIELFEKVYGQLQIIHAEISALSKKSPNDAINEFKLTFVNQVLAQSNKLLKGDMKPLDGFNEFNLDVVPTNSDVVFVVAQYIECLDKLKSDNVKRESFGSWQWVVEEDDETRRTSAPAVRHEH
jgi:hypothetical protein